MVKSSPFSRGRQHRSRRPSFLFHASFILLLPAAEMKWRHEVRLGPDGSISRWPASRFCVLSSFLSVTHPEIEITCLLSSTHPEHFYNPFVFRNPSRGLFIFNIFWSQRPASDLFLFNFLIFSDLIIYFRHGVPQFSPNQLSFHEYSRFRRGFLTLRLEGQGFIGCGKRPRRRQPPRRPRRHPS